MNTPISSQTDFSIITIDRKHYYRRITTVTEIFHIPPKIDNPSKPIIIDGYYKMDAILQAIETATNNQDSEHLIQFASDHVRELTLTNRATLASITDQLLACVYTHATEQQLESTFPRVRILISKQTQNLNNKRKRFYKLRNILKKRFGEQSMIVKTHRSMGMTHLESVSVFDTSRLNRQAKLRDRSVIIDRSTIDDIIYKFAISEDVFDQIIAVQLATGSRYIEVIRLSDYTLVQRTTNKIRISNIAKKGDPKFSVVRPLIRLDSMTILVLIKKIRQALEQRYPEYPTWDNNQLTIATSQNVNRRIAKLGLTEEGSPPIKSTHGLRKVYANYSYLLLPEAKRKRIALPQYVADVLGHKFEDSALNYINVRIQDDDQKDGEIQVLSQVDIASKPTRKFMVNGVWVEIELNNTVPIKSRDTSIMRCIEKMRELHSKRIKLTEKNLKSLGFGSSTLSSREVRDEKTRLTNRPHIGLLHP